MCLQLSQPKQVHSYIAKLTLNNHLPQNLLLSHATIAVASKDLLAKPNVYRGVFSFSLQGPQGIPGNPGAKGQPGFNVSPLLTHHWGLSNLHLGCVFCCCCCFCAENLDIRLDLRTSVGRHHLFIIIVSRKASSLDGVRVTGQARYIITGKKRRSTRNSVHLKDRRWGLLSWNRLCICTIVM